MAEFLKTTVYSAMNLQTYIAEEIIHLVRVAILYGIPEPIGLENMCAVIFGLWLGLCGVLINNLKTKSNILMNRFIFSYNLRG